MCIRSLRNGGGQGRYYCSSRLAGYRFARVHLADAQDLKTSASAFLSPTIAYPLPILARCLDVFNAGLSGSGDPWTLESNPKPCRATRGGFRDGAHLCGDAFGFREDESLVSTPFCENLTVYRFGGVC